jgi:hypothetical protein
VTDEAYRRHQQQTITGNMPAIAAAVFAITLLYLIAFAYFFPRRFVRELNLNVPTLFVPAGALWLSRGGRPAAGPAASSASRPVAVRHPGRGPPTIRADMPRTRRG